MQYDNLMEILKTRRSIRRFKADSVADDLVDKIIEAGRLAPSGFNMQPWEFVVLRDPSLQEKIFDTVEAYKRTQFDEMELMREPWQGVGWKRGPTDAAGYRIAPVYILVLGDTRTKAGLPMAVRYTDHKRESIFTSGLANAFLCMHLAATALGLGAQWVTAVQMPQVRCFIKNLLGIPETLETYDMMALGYSDMSPRGKFLRDTTEMVHRDYCGPEGFRTDEKVRDFIRKARNWALAVNPDRMPR